VRGFGVALGRVGQAVEFVFSPPRRFVQLGCERGEVGERGAAGRHGTFQIHGAQPCDRSSQPLIVAERSVDRGVGVDDQGAADAGDRSLLPDLAERRPGGGGRCGRHEQRGEQGEGDHGAFLPRRRVSRIR